MTDKEKILAEIESLLNKTNYEPFTDEVFGRIQTLKELKSYINSLQEEPVSEGKDIFDNCLKSEEKFILPQKISGNIDCENCLYSSACALGDIQACIIDKPVNEDLEKAAIEAFKKIVDSGKNSFLEIFKAGAQWQKEQDKETIELAEDHAMLAGMEKMKEQMMKNIWKPADGDDLPEIDREVITLLDNGKVVFAHRPPEFWDGKNIVTGKVTRNYPKTYDKGGWNIPDVKFWLDVELPKEIEL